MGAAPPPGFRKGALPPFARLKYHEEMVKIMGEIEVIYKDGVLKLVSPAKIEGERIVVRIINRDEILTEEDMRDIIEAVEAREKGKYYTMEDVFE